MEATATNSEFRFVLVTLLWLSTWAAHAQFPLPDDLNPVAENAVDSLAVQPDGKILVGGRFSKLGGQPRSGIGRLNADGTLDLWFNPGVSIGAPYYNAAVQAMAVQTDGKILVGGLFATLAGQPRSRLGRLNSDGTLDSEFDPGADSNSNVSTLVIQADGKILVGGSFTTLAGQPRNYLGRLNTDGTLDTGFNPGPDDSVLSLALQADGKILVGGKFTMVGGQPRTNLARLNVDGTLDGSFNAAAEYVGATFSPVYALAVQADGKIVVGGYFTSLANHSRNYIGRLNADGTLDNEFNPGADFWVDALSIQADGKMLVGGAFATLGGQPSKYIGRLHPDGSMDNGFNPAADLTVHALTVQGDGKVVVGGAFNTLGGQPRTNIGRLTASSPATQNLNTDGSSITWLRGGTSAEFWRTTFDLSTNGLDWISLGSGVRIPGGWQLENLSLVSNRTIRARGFTAGNNGSWHVEIGIGPPAFDRLPLGQGCNPGTTVTLDALATGSEPIYYQWRKDGVALADGAKIAGAQRTLLVVSNVFGAETGDYSVVASNSQGSVTSTIARVIVADPLITSQPLSQTSHFGGSVTFSVAALGTAPNYQWLKDGLPLPDRTNASILLTGLDCYASGGYTAVASNQFGSVTSSVANLLVRDPFITRHPTNLLATLGLNTNLEATVIGTPPLNYQWRKDGVNLSGQTQGSLALTNVQISDGGGYQIVVSNVCGVVTSAVAVVTVNAAPPDSLNPGADFGVYALALQGDGKILVGGDFTRLGGQVRNYIGRLNSDGTVDGTFNPGATAFVFCLALQEDRKILVGGGFSMLGGFPRSRIGRLNADGTLDVSFTNGAASTVCALAVQTNGQILAAGSFTKPGGSNQLFMARLNPDGSVDDGFNAGANGVVRTLAVQADGKILLGGDFSRLGGTNRSGIGRLNADGTLDTTFNPGANAPVRSLAVQADGKILVGGSFSVLAGQSRNSLGRLNSDGAIDSSFNPRANSAVVSIVVQSDGRILAGGSFTSLRGKERNRIGRLYADGTLDDGFNPGADSSVNSLTVQTDGKVLVAGNFKALGGKARANIGRLAATDPATQSLNYDGSTLVWQRGGTSPEVWSTTFALSTNGVTWQSLGAATRVLGGWQLTNLSVSDCGAIRARGFAAGGYGNGSGWFLEAYLPVGSRSLPRMPTDDGNFGVRSNQFGFTLQGDPGQVVVLEGSTNLLYWLPLQTNKVPYYFSDPAWPTTPQRYYRARLWP